jgi:hypothetical protein
MISASYTWVRLIWAYCWNEKSCGWLRPVGEVAQASMITMQARENAQIIRIFQILLVLDVSSGSNAQDSVNDEIDSYDVVDNLWKGEDQHTSHDCHQRLK